MRMSLIVAVAVLMAGCSNSNSNSRSEGRWENRHADEGGARKANLAKASVTNNVPTTTISMVQNVVTDDKVIGQTKLAKARGGQAVGKHDNKLKPIALFYGPLPTGLTMTSDGRLFVNFPRWGKYTNYTVAEVKNGQLIPFPDVESNKYFPSQPERADAKTHLVSVQSVVADAQDRVWLVDTGSINMGPIVDAKGPKLWAIEAKSGKRVKEITFENTVKKNSYLNDIRFDLKRGKEGIAYITDSGAGGIIVVDLASGRSWRKLDGHPSVMANDKIDLGVEGKTMRKLVNGKETKPLINSDGIALSTDAKTLFFTPLTGREVYQVPTGWLVDEKASEDKAPVEKFTAKPSANDGLFIDGQWLYTSDFEDNCIRRFNTTARDDVGQVLVQDERLLWPDTFWVKDGVLYVTANQLNRQADYNEGTDLTEAPFVIFSYPLK